MLNSQNSIQTGYGGQTQSKTEDHFSAHPSCTNGLQTSQSYSLAAFIKAPDSALIASTRSAEEIIAAHQARVAAQINVLAAHLL
ncbi:hypothetical protein F4679DRAFT_580828 [Xylaria curta]|nr:hypothetical protein F4679DRAFT_580828 [Xylaria curta]